LYAVGRIPSRKEIVMKQPGLDYRDRGKNREIARKLGNTFVSALR
jgi:hypothetical protein